MRCILSGELKEKAASPANVLKIFLLTAFFGQLHILTKWILRSSTPYLELMTDDSLDYRLGPWEARA